MATGSELVSHRSHLLAHCWRAVLLTIPRKIWPWPMFISGLGAGEQRQHWRGGHRQRAGLSLQAPRLLARLPLPLGLAALGQTALQQRNQGTRAAHALWHELRAGTLRRPVQPLQSECPAFYRHFLWAKCLSVLPSFSVSEFFSVLPSFSVSEKVFLFYRHFLRAKKFFCFTVIFCERKSLSVLPSFSVSEKVYLFYRHFLWAKKFICFTVIFCERKSLADSDARVSMKLWKHVRTKDNFLQVLCSHFVGRLAIVRHCSLLYCHSIWNVAMVAICCTAKAFLLITSSYVILSQCLL